jgi:hypothetical protein
VATLVEVKADPASLRLVTTLDALGIAFETSFEWVHRFPFLCHEDKKEKTLGFLPESLRMD